MTIRQLSLSGFRNLKSTTLDFHSGFNLISGANGSGKTSLVEAVHIICQGQSFKTTRLDECIQHGESSFLLFAQFNDYKAGFSRENKITKLRLNEININKLSEFTEKSPIRIINSNSFYIVDGSPGTKRAYMDWILFHVEQSFKTLWSHYQHALKQRNSLLRKKTDILQLDYWDKYLSDLNQQIYHQRKSIISKLNHCIKENLMDLISDLDIGIRYQPGWNNEKPLSILLKSQRKKDLKLGFTGIGIHRDNIEITSKGHPVQSVLSRGQLKRLASTMLLAQIYIVQALSKSVILIIDDIAAELDKFSAGKILQMIPNLNVQTFLTNIEQDSLLTKYQQEYKMFHVEHGIILPVKTA